MRKKKVEVLKKEAMSTNKAMAAESGEEIKKEPQDRESSFEKAADDLHRQKRAAENSSFHDLKDNNSAAVSGISASSGTGESPFNRTSSAELAVFGTFP